MSTAPILAEPGKPSQADVFDERDKHVGGEICEALTTQPLAYEGLVSSVRRISGKLCFTDVADGPEDVRKFLFKEQHFEKDGDGNGEHPFPSRPGDFKRGDVVRIWADYEEVHDGGAAGRHQCILLARRWKRLHRPDDGGFGPGRPEASEAAARSAASGGALCRNFRRTGRCRAAESGCPFRHVLEDGEEEEVAHLRRRVVKDREREATERARYDADAESGCNDETHGSPRERSHRAAVFARWLLETFDANALAAGSGVLDVAGGKGHLSVELLLASPDPNQRATVVDPWTRGSGLQRRDRRRLRAAGRNEPNFVEDEFDIDWADEEAVQNCGVLVGLHPDRATGAIVETAVAARKPFAVVPCCVFAADFPDRFVPGGSGRVVHTVRDLIEWIQMKHPNVRTARLNVKGRNRVVYATGYL
mmetsp:Transcript_25206/g.50145  ORF Transcript_25206/g.50145 Transcript_25206/m.50145 type:complete len:420 (+) Transcript_25206:86-1345(+)|eukprot:CAMPEP_0194323486 /NCGR_PEP_ID=MMETSP0171-20130528/25776_1 /TAXON_ID=218684 /ORGANISM="Corethron pennatum, Strain L29A3" /LENGTH=419 /DNA_ID=CAMNT_0039082145 /DNA_START=25 /DNA_END=1284 /DNA_ORIENTATION=-